MVRKTLLATTALVLGASVAFAMHVNAPINQRPNLPGEHFGTAGHVVHGVAVEFSIGNTKNLPAIRNNKLVPGGKIFSNFSKDKNAEFVSWYGFRVENSAFSYYYSSHDFVKGDDVANNAIPFTTKGGTLKSMSFGGFAYESTAEWQGQILSATASGLPGNALATTSSTTESDQSLCCTSVRTVKFTTGGTLPAGNYFATVVCANSPCNGGWAMEDTDFSGATVDYYHFNDKSTYNFGTGTHTNHFSSPWHKSTYYPTAGAVVIK